MSEGVSAQRRQKLQGNALYWCVLFLSGVFWGLTGPFSKTAISTGHHPIGVTFWVVVVGCVLMGTVLVATKRRLPLSRRHLVFYAACGILGTVLPNSLTYASYEHLSVGLTAILLALVPIFTFALALFFRIDQPDLERITGLLLGIGSICLIMLPSSSLPERGDIFWVAILIIVALSYALETIVISLYKPKDCDAITTLSGLTFGAFLMLAPIVWLNNYAFDISRLGAPELATLVNGLLQFSAYLLYIWLLDKAGPVFAAQTAYIITGVGVIAGIVYFHEVHSPWVWGALALMMVGVTLVKPRA